MPLRKNRGINSRLFPIAVGVLALIAVLTRAATAQPEYPQAHGAVKRDGIWDTLTIPVCWKADYPALATQKAWVRDAVHQAIETASTYQFAASAEWPVCDTRVVHRIEVALEESVDAKGDPAPAHSDVGVQYGVNRFNFRVPKPTLTVLDPDFKRWNINCSADKSSPAYFERCFRVVAVHEFLHAIGFYHEQYNFDLPAKDPDCYKWISKHSEITTQDEQDFQKEKAALPQFWAITAYDPHSIMNYCYSMYTSTKPTLSDLDLTTLHKLQEISACIATRGRQAC